MVLLPRPCPQEGELGIGTLWAVSWFCWLNRYNNDFGGTIMQSLVILINMHMYTNTALVVNVSHMPNHKPVIWLAVLGSWIVESAKPRNGSKGARLFPPLGGVVWVRDCIIPDFQCAMAGVPPMTLLLSTVIVCRIGIRYRVYLYLAILYIHRSPNELTCTL